LERSTTATSGRARWPCTASRSLRDADSIQLVNSSGDNEKDDTPSRSKPRQSRAPIIALADSRSLEQTLVLFDAGIDDVLPKPASRSLRDADSIQLVNSSGDNEKDDTPSRSKPALKPSRSLEQTLVLFDAGIDDVLPKPVHVREILARAEAI
jgi:DNA-binding response OmpR family regulator